MQTTLMIFPLFSDFPLNDMFCDVSVKITELWINMATTSELTQVHLLLRAMATNILCPFVKNKYIYIEAAFKINIKVYNNVCVR